jgi:arylformamidase
MKLWDISVPVSPDIVTWPGDPSVTLQRRKSIPAGDNANVSQLVCGVHTGTHMDAPVHFLEGGTTIEQLSLERCIGPALVAEVPADADAITPQHLDALQLPAGTTRLLLKTRNSALWATPAHRFQPDFVALTPEAATWVVERGVQLIGIDYLSIQRFHDDDPLTHQVLLRAGVVIVEGLNLLDVAAGSYQLVCLPIKLVGSDGAPARAVLLEQP